jgi:hypothetical protein
MVQQEKKLQLGEDWQALNQMPCTDTKAGSSPEKKERGGPKTLDQVPRTGTQALGDDHGKR